MPASLGVTKLIKRSLPSNQGIEGLMQLASPPSLEPVTCTAKVSVCVLRNRMTLPNSHKASAGRVHRRAHGRSDFRAPMIPIVAICSSLTAAAGRGLRGRLSAALPRKLQPSRAHRWTNGSVRKSMCLRNGAMAIGLKRLGKTLTSGISKSNFSTAPIREEGFSELFSQVRNFTQVSAA